MKCIEDFCSSYEDVLLYWRLVMNKWISVKDSLPSKEEYDWVLISPVANENPKDRLVPMVAELRNGKWANGQA